MYDERVLKAVLRFGLDKQSLQQVQAGTKTIGDALRQLESQAESTRRKMLQFREIGNTLGSISMTMRDIGRGVGGDLGKAIENIGSLGDLASRGIRLVADVKMIWASGQQMLAAQLMDTAANKMVTAGTTMGNAGVGGLLSGGGKWLGRGLATAGGVMVGASIYDAIKPKDQLDAGQILRGVYGVIEAGWSGLIGGREALDASMQRTRDAIYGTGSNEESQQQNEQAFQVYKRYREQEIDLEDSYGKERLQTVERYAGMIADAEARYASSRARLITDFTAQQKQAQEDFESNRARQYREFHAQQAQSEAEYYAERKRTAANYSREIQRMEEDHQRAMLRSKEDHDTRMRELLESGDVKGLERELHDYERNRRRAEEDYGVQSGRKSTDYAAQIAEREAQFAQQRAQVLRAFQQRMADEAADFANRQAQAKKQHDDRLKQLDEQHKEEMNKLDRQQREALLDLDRQYAEERMRRRKALNDQLADLNIYLKNERDMRMAYYQAMRADFEAYLQSDGSIPGRATGGYAGYGVYRLGEKGTEFVLSARTTRAAEVAAGGRLSQERVLAALSGRSGAVTWNDHRRFDSRLSVSDRRAIQQDTIAVMKQMYGGL